MTDKTATSNCTGTYSFFLKLAILSLLELVDKDSVVPQEHILSFVHPEGHWINGTLKTLFRELAVILEFLTKPNHRSTIVDRIVKEVGINCNILFKCNVERTQ